MFQPQSVENHAGVGGSDGPGSAERWWKWLTLSLALTVALLLVATLYSYRRPSSDTSRQELAEFFGSASVGLHSVGPDGIIMWASQAELDLLGYSREEYVGHHIAEFHADKDVIADILARLKRGETLTNYPASLRCKDGSIRRVLIDSSVVWKDGKFLHTRCFTRLL